VLTATQSIFFRCKAADPATAVNQEAAQLLSADPARFKQAARDVVRRSRTQIYDDPPQMDDSHAIKFTPWNEAELEPVRLYLLNGRKGGLPARFYYQFDRNYTTSGGGSERRDGLSWVDAEAARFMVDLLPVVGIGLLLPKTMEICPCFRTHRRAGAPTRIPFPPTLLRTRLKRLANRPTAPPNDVSSRAALCDYDLRYVYVWIGGTRVMGREMHPTARNKRLMAMYMLCVG